jgi:isochorismate hydrolase
MKIFTEQTIALAVDYQDKLLPVLNNQALFLKNSHILLCGLQELGVPILFSRQYPQGLGDINQELMAQFSGYPIYDKTTFSCYGEPKIKAALQAAGRPNVILCGAEAHICVLQTLLCLQDAGYQAILVADCVTSRRESDRELGIKRAAKEGGLLTSYEALLFELTKDSKAPVFRTISKLVK